MERKTVEKDRSSEESDAWFKFNDEMLRRKLKMTQNVALSL